MHTGTLSSIGICLIVLFLAELPVAQGVTRVVIAGAGPAGLLTAHCLLSRGDIYEVRVIEARERELSQELRRLKYLYHRFLTFIVNTNI